MKKGKEQVRMCSCGAPLHWTFLYNGAEYYCMNCGYTAGMLGAGEMYDETTERRAARKVAKDVFKSLRKHLHGDGCFQRTKCKKCQNSNEYHPRHATKYEKAKNEVAVKILDSLRGYYDD